MSDLVVTCPRHFWLEWIAEGDAAGDPDSGQEYAWHTARGTAAGDVIPPIAVGERLYVVAWGKLRGYAIVTDVRIIEDRWCVCRRGDAVAVTIDNGPIRGFQAWRYRWWDRADERPFPDWKTAGVPARQAA